MSETLLNKLTQLFPATSEEFLKGIYDSYREEDVDIEQLVDVILSFEFLPPRENYNENSLPVKTDIQCFYEPVNTVKLEESTLPPTISSSTVSAESQVLAKDMEAADCEANGESLINDNKSLVDDLCNGSEHQREELAIFIHDSSLEENSQTNESLEVVVNMENEQTNTVEESQITNSFEKKESNMLISAVEGPTCINSQHCSDEGEEEESLPECYIKYLEGPTFINNQHCSDEREDEESLPECYIKYLEGPTIINNQHCSDEGEDEESLPECYIKYIMGDKENTNNEGNSNTFSKDVDILKAQSVFPESNINVLTNECKRDLLPEESITGNNACENRYRNIKFNVNKLGNRQKHIFSNQKSHHIGCKLSQPSCSQDVSHNSSKKLSVQSYKIKNEEERLRRKLLNKSKLLHMRQERNINSPVCPSQFESLDNKHMLLCKVFPDADPGYLFKQCDLLTDQDKILVFISENLELKDYPKVEMKDYGHRLMERFECTIDQFLEVIPDPVEEFSSSNYIRTGYEENAEIYLKTRYQGLSDEEVKNRLIANQYNMTSICAQLEREGYEPTPNVLEYTPLHHSANVFFHQEVWFIEHRAEVQNFLDSAFEALKMEDELNRPPLPPPVDEAFECAICSEEIVEYSELGSCDGPSGHLFCNNCIKRSVEIRIGDGEITFPCLTNCGCFIPLQTIQELLPRPTYNKLLEKIQEDEIRKANIPGVECCPFCPFAYGPGEDPLFICLNPACKKLSCRICRKEDHTPDLCQILKDEDEENARHIIENRMAEALMRTCYSCGRNFVKSSGCNKMACTCGAKMCYICRQPVKDYTHFNGEGGDNFDRCPLFSADEELHVRPVQATAQQAFDQIVANNPGLNLDRNRIIPN